MIAKTFPVKRPFDVTRLGNQVKEVTFEPDANERARMIETYGLLDLKDMTCVLRLRPWRKDGVAVDGHLRARAIQPCVVTLAPVEQEMDETFSRRFDPHAARQEETAEIDVEAFSEDPPDPLAGRDLDLGAVVCEQFALALELYPRAAEAEVPEAYRPAEEDGGDGAGSAARPSPFAVLAEFKKNSE
ncbi:DUF177 domain-containing protein [Stappia sp. ES.058]|uniref:YceD family protein n=1 Tax=Stappia sp. ES.058 TaxID=1881061 RepID=UPI00087CAA80|nr:DUF177 domain-containing protein [Stappia sp. ES.058]SDU06359.1 Uncharacterized metal-binding protein YceD, DUF177 family [Stappia sp. ES.058]